MVHKMLVGYPRFASNGDDVKLHAVAWFDLTNAFGSMTHLYVFAVGRLDDAINDIRRLYAINTDKTITPRHDMDIDETYNNELETTIELPLNNWQREWAQRFNNITDNKDL